MADDPVTGSAATDEHDPPMDIKVTCKPCGGKFAMVDRGSRVLNALREWDKEHKHPEATDGT